MKTIKQSKKNKKEKDDKNIFVKEILFTLISSFIMAIGISLFLLPNQLSTGGVIGVATITYYLFNIPMGKMMLYINIFLFLFSGYKISREIFIKSIIGTVSLSFFVDILDKIPPLTNDMLLASIYGGVIIGISTAILLKFNSSTGGSDLISYIVKEYKPEIKSGNMIIFIDTFVIILNMIFLKEIEIGLYSTISIYIMGKVIDLLFEGTYFTKMMIIVSNKGEKIANEVKENIKRGVTGLYGKGMYNKQDKLVLMIAVDRSDVNKIKLLAKAIDEKCFIIITNSKEVVRIRF